MKKLVLIILGFIAFNANAANESKSITESTTENAPEIHSGTGGGWFLSVRSFILKSQLDQCENYKTAGNTPIYERCERTTLNADKFLTKKAENSYLPATGWSMCADQIQYDLPSGARCIEAVELICPLDKNHQFVDFNKCYQVMQSGAWLLNPKIAHLSFD